MLNKRIYFVIYLCAAIGPLAGNAILAMLIELQTTLHASEFQVMLSIPAFMFPFAIFQLFTGTLSDKWGRKSSLILGLLIYAVSCVAISVVSDLSSFLLLRITQGIGNAFIAPVALAMLGDITERSQYGMAMGFYGSSTTAGVVAGPIIGGFLAEVDWRLAFIVLAALAFISMLLVLIVISYSGSNIRRPDTSLMRNINEAVRHRNIILSSSIGAMGFLASIGSLSFLSLYLRSSSFALGPSEMGIIISMGGFVGIFFSPIAGRLTDICSPRLATILGICITAPAVLLTAFVGEYYQFLALSSLNGIGTSFMWTGLLTTAVGEVPRLRGTTSSIFNSSRFTGYAVSSILLWPIYSDFRYIGIAFACTGILLAGVLIALALPAKPCREKSEIPPAADSGKS